MRPPQPEMCGDAPADRKNNGRNPFLGSISSRSLGYQMCVTYPSSLNRPLKGGRVKSASGLCLI